MKIIKLNHIESTQSTLTYDSFIDNGYIKAHHGSLPDIDSDFAADKRSEVKAYIEKRYNTHNMQRVFSAGTFTTIKIKSAIKDIARVYKIPMGTTNYLTAILEDSMTWTDVMKMAVTDKRIKEFINKYPNVFEDILPIMGQARSAGIHASALIITPTYVKNEKVDCYDLLPVRKMGDLLVSEISGYDIDAIGILKNDTLGIQELTRLSDMLTLIEKEYGVKYTILQIVSQYLEDKKAFELLQQGHTQGVFQMSGQGITRFIKQLKPDCVKDLIASVALFRPGTLESGAAQGYVDAKNGLIEPEYLYGTYDILKDTYGFIVYQEQVANIARKIGGLSLGDGVNLVKALSKKKLEKVRKFKEKFFVGAEKNHCPKEAADAIWNTTESAAKYLFNKSHATAYGLTAYVGAWLKAHYPMPFYTVILRDCDDDKLPTLMNEMKMVGGAKIVQPDINISGTNFTPDYKNNKIYWSLSRIKWVGSKAVEYIVKERTRYGDFVNLEEFIRRIFRQKFVKFKNWDDPADGSVWDIERCPVNARVVRNLIYAGAFDNCDRIGSVCERYGLLQKAAEMLGFYISDKEVPEGMENKHYFWSQQQITLAGVGSVDYQRIWNNLEKPSAAKSLRFLDFDSLDNVYLNIKKAAVVGTIIEVHEKTYKSHQDGQTKHFGKITLQQNTQTAEMILWDATWAENKHLFVKQEGTIIAAVATIKWSDYNERNELQVSKGAFITDVR
jgi:DNA polymerase III subunit alpha